MGPGLKPGVFYLFFIVVYAESTHLTAVRINAVCTKHFYDYIRLGGMAVS